VCGDGRGSVRRSARQGRGEENEGGDAGDEHGGLGDGDGDGGRGMTMIAGDAAAGVKLTLELRRAVASSMTASARVGVVLAGVAVGAERGRVEWCSRGSLRSW
jgi:hypothetical protein